MSASYAIDLLDNLSACSDNQIQYKAVYEDWTIQISQLLTLKQKLKEQEQQAEFKNFLLRELEEVQPVKGEEKQLDEEQVLLENAEDWISKLSAAEQLLEGDQSIHAALYDLQQLIGKALDPDLSQRLNAVRIEMEDIAQEISRLAERVEVNPQRLQEVNERLSALFSLKTKHHVQSADELIAVKAELESEMLDSRDLQDQITQLEQSTTQLEEQLRAQAEKMSKLRQNGISVLEAGFNEALPKLGMPHSSIKATLVSSVELTAYGYDKLELMLSSDKGQSFGPLKKQASGGELSRLNLIAKSLTTQTVHPICSVLDEIDSGVSGEVARRVGALMKKMSGDQQLVVITHLPQIASLADRHFKVYKIDEAGIETRISSLDMEGRVHEIAKMISGDQLTESALAQSQALLQEDLN